jgi:hypothetical protein
MPLFKPTGVISVTFLVLANLIPFGGVLYYDWDVATLIVLYWAENLIIGFYSILKILFVRLDEVKSHLGKLALIPFFCLHYGGFCGGHGFFLLLLLKLGNRGAFFSESSWPGPLVFVADLFLVVPQLLRSMPRETIWPIMALAVSHGVSFVQNYLLRQEFATSSIESLMAYPYKRIVVLHVAIIAAAFPVMALESPLPLLLVLILLKLALDVFLHVRSHAPASVRKPELQPETWIIVSKQPSRARAWRRESSHRVI